MQAIKQKKLLIYILSYTVLFACSHFVQCQEQPVPVVQNGHAGTITSINFSINGKWLLTASGDGITKLWNTSSRKLIRNFHAPSSPVVSFSPNNNMFVVAGGKATERKKIILLNFPSGKEHLRWDGGRGPLKAVTFHPKENILATTSGYSINFWNTLNGKKVAMLTPRKNQLSAYSRLGDIHALAFSPNGKMLASGDWEGNILLWNTQSKNLVKHFKNKSSAVSLAFSPNGRWLASVSNSYGIIVREIVTGKRFSLVGADLSFAPHTVDFSNDGKYIAAGGLRSIKIWNFLNGQIVKQISTPDYGHTSWINKLVFSPKGMLIAAGSDKNTTFLWELASLSQDGRLGTRSSGIDKVAINHNATTAAFVFRKGPHIIWQFKDAGLLHTLTSKVNAWPDALALNHDGSLFATGDALKNIRVRNIRDGKEKHLFQVDNSVRNIEFSSSDKFMAVADSLSSDDDDGIKIFNLSTEEEEDHLSHKGANHVAFTKSEDKLVSSSWDNSVKLWNLKTSNEIQQYTGHKWFITDLAISSDDRYLAVSSFGGSVKVWDIINHKLAFSLQSNGSDSIAFSPDNKRLAIAGYKSLIILKFPSGQMLFDLSDENFDIDKVKFTPDGTKLITVGKNGLISLWHAQNGVRIAQVVLLHDGSGKIDWLSFDSSGFFDGTRNAWQLVPFRFPSNPLKLYEPEQFFNQFYQPGLLADIFREGKPMREILQAQGDPRAKLDISKYRHSKIPTISLIAKYNGTVSTRNITVTIKAKDNGSGLRDLRVFRNQSLVHFKHGKLKPDPITKTYSLHVPVKLLAGKNEISAYVFNHDNIKSKDSSVVITGTKKLKRKGTAYVIAIGINQYNNPKFINLDFAVADATAMSQSLTQNFNKLERYAKVVPISLLNHLATRKNILAALARLSGNTTSLATSSPAILNTIKPAQPEDAVIVFFSGHGTAKGDRYYLVPHKSKAISDLDLEVAFEKVDAGNIMLLIDACQSGQALEAEEKRRGPMNSRGLAQLAYEKGMYILAAAQSDEDANEFKKLGHGLLTYTLIEEGLKQGHADVQPKDKQLTAREWLDYAVQRVPQLTIEAIAQFKEHKGKNITFEKNTVTSQAPRAYYRRTTDVENEWIVSRQ